MEESEIMPWDDEAEAIAPRDDMSVLDQLKLYQFVVRSICPFLDPYETAVLIQIVDRVTGWRKREARFGLDKLLGGDRKYGGIARTMHRSRMMKALGTLELRGVITRREQPSGSPVKIYRINFHLDLGGLEASAPRLRAPRKLTAREKRVSNGDQIVSPVHHSASEGDHPVSQQDTRERYHEKCILTNTQDNGKQPELLAPAARSRKQVSSEEEDRGAQARPGNRSEIIARPRRRLPSR